MIRTHVGRTPSGLIAATEEVLLAIAWSTEDMSLAAFLLARGDVPDAISRLSFRPLFSFLKIPHEGLAAWEREELVGKDKYMDAYNRLDAIVGLGKRCLLDSVRLGSFLR